MNVVIIETIRHYNLPCSWKYIYSKMLLENSGVLIEQYLSPQGAVEEQVVAYM